ncbi:MAG: transcriptional regulator [Methylococcaceae bacterium]|nr:transcriptional regulator [Methylococcaceae bacterium]
MQLALTILGSRTQKMISEVLLAVSDCKCIIVEMSSSQLSQATAAYLLIEGNWNHIAKFENTLETLQKNLELQIHTLRSNKAEKSALGMPYSLEIITLDQENIIQAVVSFLYDHQISIQEFSASRYQAAYNQSLVFSAKFIVIIPKDSPLLSVREHFLDFCDQLNIDAILEPVKR